MSDDNELDELLASPDVRFLALDPEGGRVVPMPFELPDDRVIEATVPLRPIEPSTQGAAVIAFEHARRTGHGSAQVALVGDDGGWWLDIIDVSAEHGCFVAAFSPVDPTAPTERPSVVVVPRRGSFSMDVSGVVLAVSDEMTAMLGWTPDDLVGRSSLHIVHPDDQEAGIYAWADLLQGGDPIRLRQRLARKEGGWLWVESTELNLLDDPEAPRVVSEFIDISREVTAEAALQRRETVLDRLYRALPTGVAVIDPDGSVAAVNERWRELVGEAGRGPLEALLARLTDRRAVMAAISGAIRDGADVDLQLDLDDATTCRHAALHVRPLIDGGHHVGLLLTLDDTTERSEYERALAEQMRHDPLTGALNRLGVEEEIRDRLATGVELGLLYLDLDEFKSVNDTRGHAAGDRLLCEVVKAVRAELSPDDLMARIGGDEFLVVLARPDRRGELAERIRRRVCELDRRLDLPVTVSVGGTSSMPGDDLDRLIGRADAAMYEDKALHRRASGRDRRRQAVASD